MLRKYNFLIFTLVFCLLFGLIFFRAYTREDTTTPAGQTMSEPAYGQTAPESSPQSCGCSSCSCNQK